MGRSQNRQMQFKQFVVRDDKCAMKIGTDGVLLGAWSNLKNARNILDIGCGTGLICLMAAQRNQSANITGIELEINAFNQAKENCKKSQWSNRISIIHSSLQSYKLNSKFVAVTVNPTDEFIKSVVLGNFDFIQLHGSETKERVNEIKSTGLKIIKAIKKTIES